MRRMRVVVSRVPMRNKVALNIFLPKKQRGNPITIRTAPQSQEYFCMNYQRALSE